MQEQPQFDMKFQSIFHSIETPHSADFLHKLSGNETRVFWIFFLSSILWSIAVTAFSAVDIITGLPENFLIHPSVATILVGFALFPIRWAPISIGIYIASFFTSMLVNSILLTDQPFGWQLIGLSFTINLFVGSTCGMLSMLTFQQARRMRFSLPAVTVSGAVLAISYTCIAFLVALMISDFAQTLTVYPLQTLGDFALFQRAFRIAVLSSAAYFVFLDIPSARHVREALIFAPLFSAKGILTNHGIFLGELLDPVMLGAVLLLTRPIYLAITSTVIGFCAYAMITGQYIVQNPIPDIDALRIEITSSANLGVMLLISLARVGMHSYNRRQYETLSRVQRAQNLARLGYFVVDVNRRVGEIDHVAQDILGMPQMIDTAEFTHRLHPEDRELFAKSATSTAESRTFSLRFNRSGPWVPSVEMTIINVYLWYEKLWDSRVICYGVVIDVTEEHRQEQLLTTALSELSVRQDKQTQLFSIISHELRTPASLITMILEELDHGGEWEELGPQLHAVTDHLISVLTDMRQTVRPEQNLPVHFELVRPQAIAESIKNTFQLMAKGKNISIQLRMSALAHNEILTDRVRLVQALSNLVKNAIVHSKCTMIVISCNDADFGNEGTLRWRVWDNGIGLSLKVRSTLFEPFARDHEKTTRSDGSGLGLHIARTAIRAIGGDVAYIERPNSGACFEITLPLPDKEKVTATDHLVKEKAKNSQEQSLLSILLVEDSEMIGSLMEVRLKRLFQKVQWVGNGHEALNYVRNSPPDVVLTDLFMPGMGGDEFTQKIRSEGYRNPIIGMTAAEFGDEIETFRSSGADEVLTKPIRMDVLQNVISAALMKRVAS